MFRILREVALPSSRSFCPQRSRETTCPGPSLMKGGRAPVGCWMASRWPWHFVTFGADIKGEYRDHGLAVPEHVEAGWFYGEDTWDEGRFFEADVTGLTVS